MPDLTDDAEKARAAKIALRSRLITERRSRFRDDEGLRTHLSTLIRSTTPKTVAAYVPVGSEPGGAALPAMLAGYATVLLPVLLPSGDLDWAAYEGSLASGPRGLQEPPGPRLGVSAIRSADLVLVPALAVDRHGMRLGRGGGSYDRALARLDGTSARVVALLHDGEVVDRVPAEPHDRPVHAAVTPRGILAFSALSRGAEWTK